MSLHVLTIYESHAHEARVVKLTERVAKRILNPISTALDFIVVDSQTAAPLLRGVAGGNRRFPTALIYSASQGVFYGMDNKVK